LKPLSLSIILLLTTIVVCGQTNDSLNKKTKHEAAFDICAIYTPILSHNFYGLNLDMKYYPEKKYATGLYISCTEKKINDTFTYSIGQPILYNYEMGWINQYDFVHTDRARINVNLNNGLAMFRLGDNDIKEKYRTRYGYGYRPKEIATNYYYLLEPGIDVSYRLFSNNHYPDFYLTAEAKYRFLFGNSKYGSTNQFSNYLIAVGVSIIGFTDDNKPKSKSK
jgi:hypothetical protein